MPNTRIERAAAKAQEAFWASVASSFPEIRTGDLDGLETLRFDQACVVAVSAWVWGNSPFRRRVFFNGGWWTEFVEDGHWYRAFPDYPWMHAIPIDPDGRVPFDTNDVLECDPRAFEDGLPGGTWTRARHDAIRLALLEEVPT